MQTLLPDALTGADPAPDDVSILSHAEAPSSPSSTGLDYGDGPEAATNYMVAVGPTALMPGISLGNTGGLGCVDKDCPSPLGNAEPPATAGGASTNPPGTPSGSGKDRSDLANSIAQEPDSAASLNGDGIIAVVAVSAALIICLIAAAAAFVIVRRKRGNRANGGTADPSVAAAGPRGKPVVVEQKSAGADGVPDQQHPRATEAVPLAPQNMLEHLDGHPQLTHATNLPPPPPPPLQRFIPPWETVSREHIGLPMPLVGTGLTSTAVSADARSRMSSVVGNGSAHASRSSTAHSAATA